MADEQQPSEETQHTDITPAVVTQPIATPATPSVQTTPIQTPKPEPQKNAKPSIKQRLHEKWLKLKDFYRECVRVLKVTKKPDKQEFITVVKISGLGMLAIGLIGFLIHLAKELLL